MKHPLRRQILLPALGLLVAAVWINAIFAAFLASRKAERESTERLEHVARVLTEASFPRSQPVLDRLRQLTNADYLMWNTRHQQISASTLDETRTREFLRLLPAFLQAEVVSQRPTTIRKTRYLISRIDSSNVRGPDVLFVLLPAEMVSADRWAAMIPAVVIGCLSLAFLIPLMLHVARRLGRRIATVQRQVAAVADGSYDILQDPANLDDEIHHLVSVVNQMTTRIRELQQRIEQTERTRLLGQLAGGLAHQLRNAITGAKLATQLHLRRCPATENDTSLNVALKQLALTENQLQGLLSLGRQEPRVFSECDPAEIVTEVCELIANGAEHHGVRLEMGDRPSGRRIRINRIAIQAAVLNLALNAVEAAGRGGTVQIEVRNTNEHVSWSVRDNGDGPSSEAAARMFEPFATSKPEGVGLGLALAQQVANDHDGSLTWSRDGEWTEFSLSIPQSL